MAKGRNGPFPITFVRVRRQLEVRGPCINTCSFRHVDATFFDLARFDPPRNLSLSAGRKPVTVFIGYGFSIPPRVHEITH